MAKLTEVFGSSRSTPAYKIIEQIRGLAGVQFRQDSETEGTLVIPGIPEGTPDVMIYISLDESGQIISLRAAQ